MINVSKKHNTLDELMNDETFISKEEKAQIEFEADLICKLIDAREEQGLTQRDLAEMIGIKQPALARIESMRATPQINTLLKILTPLGYTLSIVPLKEKNKYGKN